MKAKVNGGNQYSIYKILMNWEKQRIAGQRLYRLMGKSQTGLTNVEVNTTTVKEERNERKMWKMPVMVRTGDNSHGHPNNSSCQSEYPRR